MTGLSRPMSVIVKLPTVAAQQCVTEPVKWRADWTAVYLAPLNNDRFRMFMAPSPVFALPLPRHSRVGTIFKTPLGQMTTVGTFLRAVPLVPVTTFAVIVSLTTIMLLGPRGHGEGSK